MSEHMEPRNLRKEILGIDDPEPAPESLRDGSMTLKEFQVWAQGLEEVSNLDDMYARQWIGPYISFRLHGRKRRNA